MATIVSRRGNHYVVYNYTDAKGNRKQKWETYKTISEAKARKKEVEFKEGRGILAVPNCKTLNDLLKEYVQLYGKDAWAMSTYSSNCGLIRNYISPMIGSMKLSDISTHVIERYYQQLLETKRIDPPVGKKRTEFVTPNMVREIHKLLRCCFGQAVKWDLCEKNPCINATVPKVTYQEREIWTAQTLFQATELCEDERLKLCMNLTFACSLRIGELLALTWDCVDISDESIENGTAYIYVNKELQRVGRDVLKALNDKDVILKFPSQHSHTSTVQVLKTPKTSSSVRKIFLPKTVALMLVDWKAKQDEAIEFLGSDYQNYNLVIAGPLGMPTEARTITSAFEKLIEKNNLPRVVFHSLRHSSITYKLKLNGGDVKAVQGDSGHAQARMVTDVYSHILDEDRVANAKHFEEVFYGGKGKEPTEPHEPEQAENTVQAENTPQTSEESDVQVLLRLLSNPETAKLLKTLVNGL